MKNLQSDTREAPVNVDLPFEGGDGKRLGGDLVRLSGTEEGGGDAQLLSEPWHDVVYEYLGARHTVAAGSTQVPLGSNFAPLLGEL